MTDDMQDQEFVEYVLKTVVDNPDDVHVDRTIDEMGVLLSVTVNPDDMGKVIGKSGQTAKAIRTLLKVYIFRAFIDEGAVEEFCELSSASPSALFSSFAMIFYSPSIDAFDIAINAVFGDIVQLLFSSLQTSGNSSRRLVVVQLFYNKFL